MQITSTCWTDRLCMPADAHAPPIDEPMRSLLRQRLVDLERRLLDMSQTMDKLLREAAGYRDIGGATSTAPLRSRSQEVALSEVRAALMRFDNDSYGLCASCAVPIEPGRLASRPQVLRCHFCEQQG
jgi:DnaK suppressor protein